MLDISLVDNGFVNSRQKAKLLIKSGKVIVNKIIIKKVSQIINDNDCIIIKENTYDWVSRGGEKLSAIFENFVDLQIKDFVCLDVGSGKGGFTDVLLSKKAKYVYAVDVGKRQLSEKLKFNPKVKSFEDTDIRKLNYEFFYKKFDIIVCDVSFISVTKIFSYIIDFAKENSWIIILIKPQFELSKPEIGKNGIVKDRALHLKAINSVKNFMENILNCKIIGLIDSPIKGMKGNKEFLLLLKK